MKLRVKSNGREVEMSKKVYDALPPDSKRSYSVISFVESEKEPDQVVTNQVPDTGDRKQIETENKVSEAINKKPSSHTKTKKD